MSDMRTEGVVRFKVNKEINDTNITDFYNQLKLILGDADSVDYKHVWDGDKYLQTDTIEHFEYKRKEDNFVISRSWDTGDYFVDYVLASNLQGEEDLKITLGLDEIMNIRDKAVKLFGNLIYPLCKVVVYDWYTGSDEPMYF